MSANPFFFNGINAGTGEYLIPPLTPDRVAQVARGESIAPDHLGELKWRQAQQQTHYGVKAGVDPTDLAQAGWGVIFASDADLALREALRELLEHRKQQANKIQERYREYFGAEGYQRDESKNLFLARHGAGPGAVDPDHVPYYLLIVGDPERIPYSFQSQLDVAYAVGRIHFDTLAEYSQYAQSVVRAEQENITRGKRAAFFGVANPDDPSTQASAHYLVKPLAEKMRATESAWDITAYLEQDAKKGCLETLLRDDAPALVFTASHGAGFEIGDPRQVKHQGALICQDWPGPKEMQGKPVPQTMYYAMDDVVSDAHVHGMIAFHFACFGAGTPRYDEFTHLRQGLRERMQIAPQAFLAKLPKKLLAHPKGGALAVIGHVDRAWGASFLWNQNIQQLSTFESMLTRLFNGVPVGAAMEFFNERYAELATGLSSTLEDLKYNKKIDPVEFATLWTANNDARGYAVIGDPAVRLSVNHAPATLLQTETITLNAPATLLQTETITLNAPAPENALPKSDADIEATITRLELQVAELTTTLKELRTVLKPKQA